MGLDESFLRVWAEENLVSEKSGSRRAVSEKSGSSRAVSEASECGRISCEKKYSNCGLWSQTTGTATSGP